MNRITYANTAAETSLERKPKKMKYNSNTVLVFNQAFNEKIIK